jgi:uncharacterized protein YjbI with pentapeptide repeats
LTALEKITQAALNGIIEKHAIFLKGIRGGARAVLKFKDLSDLDFHGCDLSQADLTGSLLVGANLSKGVFRSVTFFACDMRNANLEGADCSRADFRGAYVAGANLVNANLKSADLREGTIMERDENGVMAEKARPGIAGKIHRTVFTGAKMADTNMSDVQAINADFTDADLSGVMMNDSNFSHVSFNGANLSDADLTGSSIVNADMKSSVMAGTLTGHMESAGANIHEALSEHAMGEKIETLQDDLPGMLKAHSAWVESAGKFGKRLDLSGVDLRHISRLKSYSLTAVKAVGANFLNQDMSGIEMQSAVLDRADFRDCRLAHADLRGSSFKSAILTRANLSGANLSPLHFTNEDGKAWSQRVNLSGANLRYADLRNVNLSGAVLTDTDFSFADMTGANLDGADVKGAVFGGDED